MVQLVKARSIGLAAGSLWLIAVGGGFLTGSLFAIGPLVSRAAFAWLAIFSLSLIAGGIVLRRALRLPPDPTESGLQGKTIRKRFLIMVGLELAAFAIANPIVALSGHYAMFAVVNLIIVGIHFAPLASIFQVPRYYLMAFLFCAISIFTWAVFPEAQRIGQALIWLVLPSGGCGLVATLIGVAGLLESWRLAAERKAVG